MTPYALPSPCRHPGCGELTTDTRCSKHERQSERVRGTSVQRGYSYRWQKIRRLYLLQHPLCERCGQVAEQVHHKDRKPTGRLRFDFANLEALCRPCHGEEHGEGVSDPWG